MSEAALYDQIRRAAARLGCHLRRNNVGVFRTADRGRRYVRTGLGTGSPDLVGWRMISVGGATVAQFVGLEVKCAGGRVTPEQQRFLDHLTRQGGLGAVVRSVAEAEAVLASPPRTTPE